ncbi:MAG: type II toxin-antitoxin system VapC family toxin [Desulfuromonadales bacterium]|nr:type II toxin-antitoxin system VapC family toxin [Desulfuromonadales bacterium]
MNNFILDSFALLRFIQKEPGNEPVKAILDDARTGKACAMLNVINMGEVIYTVQRRFGQQFKLDVVMNISRLGIVILPAPNDLVFRAAELKARFAMSYADTFAVASAIDHDATLVTGDPVFRQVEQLVKILWI